MTNVDNFKLFVKKNPTLVKYIRNGEKTWQNFYELYDLYGEDNNVWDEYLKSNSEVKDINTKKNNSLSNIMEVAKNIDTDKLQEGISSVQKAIDLFSGMLIKDNKDANTNSYTPRPIYRKFDD